MRDWYRNGITLEVITSIQAVQTSIQANTIQVDPTTIQEIIIQEIIIQAAQITIQATLIPAVPILIQVKTPKFENCISKINFSENLSKIEIFPYEICGN